MSETKPKMELAIWDLDNCLADDSRRIGLIDWGTTDPEARYAAYHEACGDDPCSNKNIFDDVTLTMNLEPLFITGRPESVRSKTVAWIKQKLGVEAPNILMRPRGCELPSVELKSFLLDHFLAAADADASVFRKAYDDHEGIVKMYIARGIDANVLKIHGLDAYRNEDDLLRPSLKAVELAPIEELGPVRGAAPDPEHRLDAMRYMIGGLGINAKGELERRLIASKPLRADAAEILERMAATFRERNAQYRDNSRMVPKLVKVLFPEGVPSHLVTEEEWHLFELILVKLTRFATSELTHVDSIHDVGPYAAMIESILKGKQ